MLFLEHVQGLRLAASIPFWLPLVLCFAAGALTAAAGTSARMRVTVGASVLLLAGAIAAETMGRRDDETLERAWRAQSSRQIVEAVQRVGEKVARLESSSSAVGERVRERIARDGQALDADLVRTFEELASLASSASRTGVLPPGTEIGIQLVAPDGRRVAWAGWPQLLGRLEHHLLESRAELIYARKVSLYRILTHMIPVADPDGAHVATVVVDLPLEVDFRVNNRFLKSASLADGIAMPDLAGISFDYFTVTGNVADRLGRFREVLDQRAERRARIVAARAGAEPPPDSVMTYHAFPALIEPAGEITGDAAAGLHGRAVVHSPLGNPVLGVTARGRPLRHYGDARASRFETATRTLIVLTLVGPFALLMFGRRGRSRRWLRGALFVAFVAVLRYSLLSFRTSSAAGSKLFDPTIFATHALGGIMRSAGDLLVTAIFFGLMLYGLLRIARGGMAVPPAARRPRLAGFALAAVTMVAVSAAAFDLSRGFVNTIVVNANPRLLGEAVHFSGLEVVVLHVSVFVIVTGILLAAVLLLAGLLRAYRSAEAGLLPPAGAALLIMVVIAAATQRWELAFVSGAVLALVAFVPRFVRREDLVSIVTAALLLVTASSATTYVFMSRDYDDLRKAFVLEKSAEIRNPTDNWKVVILEDVLSEYARRPEIRQAIRSPGSVDVDRFAFDLWAEGPLSLLGYSCAIHVVTAEDDVLSEFAVDMPYRVRIAEGGERTDAPGDNEWAVLDLTRRTPQGLVRFYRGVLNVRESPLGDEFGSQRLIGRVIVDLPFFFEGLELAARTGPRTPELLRNVQPGSVPPRVEEPEALLLARLDGDRVYESSSEFLPVGARVPGDVFARALTEKWPLFSTPDRSFRVVLHEDGEEGRYLLAGFMVPSPLRHTLRWATLFSLYLVFTLGVIVAIMALGSIPYLKEMLPTLTPGRKLGFQQKLLASFLLVSLVPAIMLGLFSVNFIKERFVEENRQEALYKAFSARKAVVNLLHAEMQFFLEHAEAGALFAPRPDGDAIHAVGPGRVAMLFADAAAPPAPEGVVVAGVLEGASTDEVFLTREKGVPYIGVVSAPLSAGGDAESPPPGMYYVYYARRIDSDLLGEVAEQVGADVNVYDGGELVASSREGLLAGGFISAIMNARAFLGVSMLRSGYTLATERAGRYEYQVAYLPIVSWTDRSAPAGGEAVDALGSVHAAMSVPLLFRPESYGVEVQKAQSVLLGIFALLFTATIGLGLILARGIFEPLRGLLVGTRRISQGDFTVRLPSERSDEIGTVVNAFNEMTERVADSQRALEERRRYLEIILQSVGTGVISTDEDDRVRTVNAAAARILGVGGSEWVGKRLAEVTDEAGDILALLAAARGQSDAFTAGELTLVREGRAATVKYMLTRLEHEGRYLGAVFVFEDLTELIQSKKLAAWVEMARQIAHEIKNPLTPIRISTQFMQRAYEQKPEQFDRIFREGTATIIHQVDVLKRIASEFSSYGRMQQLSVAPHGLDPILRSIVAPYEKNAANVRVVYENHHRDAAVYVDPEAVRKICANLIENALDAMTGGGELRISCDEAKRGQERLVRIRFRDVGPGLSAEAAGRLFEPYFSTKTTGTGLGLAISRTLAREMGGDLLVANVADGPGVEAALLLRRA